MAKLDHIMYATADLEQGIEEIEELTGVRPVLGGAHPGRGTRNALLCLGTDQYLEIIAPDPAQNLQGTLGEEIISHGGSGIRSWAVATNNLAKLSAIIRRKGLDPRKIIDMSRTTPDGVRLDWQLLFVTGSPMLPFFIDWKDSPHPALSTPSGCTLTEFKVNVCEDAEFKSLMLALEVDVAVVTGKNCLSARIQTPRGEIELNGW